jgi:hypothetical protein
MDDDMMGGALIVGHYFDLICCMRFVFVFDFTCWLARALIFAPSFFLFCCDEWIR